MENVSIKYDNEIMECIETTDNDNIKLDVFGKSLGVGRITIQGNDLSKDDKIIKKLLDVDVYVHKYGIITIGSYFGNCKGDIAFIVSFYIVLTLINIYLIILYKKNVKKNMYSYNNAILLGLIVFVTSLSIINIFMFIYDLYYGFHSSINDFILNLKNYSYIFLTLILPIAILLTALVTISNIVLLKKEGKRWTNMLGTLLGGNICMATIISLIQGSVFSQNIYISFTSHIITMFIVYLEGIFIGVCVLGIKSARHIPKFDKDAIIILGCKIRQDGTLTNLLKSRVDRAIEFAKMQKDATGKDIIFVPSGGKGDDEIISEAQAMKNYLLEQGIQEDKIIIEDKSKNTYQNISFSNKILQDKVKAKKLAFSTTNYHVFRTGIIGTDQNLDIEGIGAKTKTYYWINAFIREFVATLVSEKNRHIKALIVLIVLVIVLVSFAYLQNNYI